MGNNTTEFFWLIASLGFAYFVISNFEGMLATCVAGIGIFIMLVMLIKNGEKRK